MISARGLTKYYGGSLAVDHIDLSVKGGEIFAFLGPNGAGKTTTVKLLCGLLAPSEGTLAVGGYDLVSHAQEAKKIIGLVPDEPYLYPKLTGWEFLQLVAGIYALDPSWRDLALKYLELFELKGVATSGSLVESFSHGMKQKLIFTSILMRKPKVWLMDEPLVGLDPKAIRIVKSLLKEKASEGACIFLSTHVLSIAEELADRIGIIQSGRLQFVGTKNELGQYLRDKNIAFGDRDTLEDLFLKVTQGGVNS